VSGNVSFYNESIKSAVPPTPGLVGVGIVNDIRKCITTDLKKEGNNLYLVGKQTEYELNGSEYFKAIGIEGGAVPKVNIDLLAKCMKAIYSVIDERYVASCHDISEGGIGVCLAEMAIGGEIGANVDISKLNDMRSDIKLFSESTTRWIIEVKNGLEKVFEKTLKKDKTPYLRIGKTGGKTLCISDNNSVVINQSLKDIDNVWRNAIFNTMG
jgi:phosphoribosylformylglycinamidine synthase